jgi:hypothetical protein
MSDLSEKIISLSVPYLGPAAKVFLERQTKSHMDGLLFDTLELKHLGELSKWVNISASLILDEGKAKELSDKIGSIK